MGRSAFHPPEALVLDRLHGSFVSKYQGCDQPHHNLTILQRRTPTKDIMADIDMTDAPSGSGSAQSKKSLGKSKATSGEGASDGKKRFEVKKVGQHQLLVLL